MVPLHRVCCTFLFACSVFAIQAQIPSAAHSPLQVAITFDDLPAHGQRPVDESRLQIAQSILATLKEQKLPPVYGFVNGSRVEEDARTLAVLQAWRAAGEPLGSHTYSHPDFDAMTPQAFEADIAKNEALLQQLAGASDWHWLRYPYLREGDTLAKRQEVQAYLKLHGYKVAEVSIDFEDYLWNNPYARCVAKHDDAAIVTLEKSYLETADQYITVFRDMTRRLYGREIPYVLLLHIGAFDAKMLPQLLQLFRDRGFTFITLEEAERDPVYDVFGSKSFEVGGGALQEMDAATRKLKFLPNHKPYKELEATCR
jgi:peptidoglycan/xylan/chitin deacetylase (PgdA/CDA1 family)